METADGMPKYFRKVNLDFAIGIECLWISIQLAHVVQYSNCFENLTCFLCVKLQLFQIAVVYEFRLI